MIPAKLFKFKLTESLVRELPGEIRSTRFDGD